MDATDPPIPLTELLAHRPWVRRVARALVVDENAAEDLEQEVWLRALQSPPREARSLRGWLGTVLRHLSTDRRRSEGARAQREERVARPEGEATRDLVAETEIHRKVVDAVLGLEEPYRTTVLQRWFEDLEPAAIAARAGIPVETVRTRLKRAVAILRDRLDGTHGGERRTWVLALGALAWRPLPAGSGAAAAGAAGAIVMGLKIKVAIAAGIVLAAGLGIWVSIPGGGGKGAGAGGVPKAPETATLVPGDPPPVPAPFATPLEPAPAPSSAWRTRLQVTVCDPAGRPVAGARLLLHPAPGAASESARDRLHPNVLGAAVAKASTAASGESALADLPSGDWVLSLEASGYPRRFEDVRIVEGQDPAALRIVLLPGCALSGTVRRREGKALPGVAVMAVRPWAGADRGYNRVSCTADAEGNYRFEALEPGLHDLLVLLPDGVLRGGGCVRVPDIKSYDIVLRGGAVLRGRVLDDATEKPVPGAALTVRVAPNGSREGWDGARDAVAETRSGPDGTFAFEDLPPGFLGELAAKAEGYMEFPDPRFDVSVVRTVFTEGLEVRRDVRLRRGAMLRGVVTGPDGKPVAGAVVSFASYWVDRFLNTPGGKRGWESRTGPDGSYRLAGVRPGIGMLDVRAEGLCLAGADPGAWKRIAEGLRPGNDAILEVPSAGETVRDLRLAATASLEGCCVDARGGTVSGLRVSLVPADLVAGSWPVATLPGGSGAPRELAPGGSGECLSDTAGVFRMAGVLPGARVVVVAEGSGGSKGWSDPVETQSGVSVQGIQVVVGRGASIAGKLKRSDGRPLVRPLLRLVQGTRVKQPNPGFEGLINAQWASACPVGPDGSFRVEGLEAGGWRFQAEDEGSAQVLGAEILVREGEAREGVELDLPPEASIAGRVTAEGGVPVTGAEVLVIPAEGTPYGEGAVTTTRQNPDGTTTTTVTRGQVLPLFIQGLVRGASATTGAAGEFRRGGLAAGLYRVVVRVAGFAEDRRDVEAGATDLAVVLRSSLEITGRVVDAASKEPVAGLLVSAMPSPAPAQGWSYMDSTTAPDGSFRIEGLAPGKYQFSLGRGYSDIGTNCLYRTFPAVEAGTKDLVFEVERGEWIEGRVVDERGEPVTWGARVAAWPMPNAKGERRGTIHDARMEPDGRFRMNAAPGTYEVFLEPEASPFGTAPIMKTSLKDVAPGTRDLVLTARRGAVISGRVLFPKDPSIRRWSALPVYVRPSGQEIGFEVDRKSMALDVGGGDRVAYTFTTPMLEPGSVHDVLVLYHWGNNHGGAIARGVLAGTRDVVLEIAAGEESVSGTVVDEAGNPLAGVPVYAKASAGLRGESVFSRDPFRGGAGVSGPDGSFTVTGLGKYRYRLITGGQDGTWARVDHPDEVPAGATGVNVRARGGVTISGTLVGADGKPAEYLYLLVLGAEGKPIQSVMTSKEDGSFTLAGVAPGKVRLGATLRGNQVDLGVFEAPAKGLSLRMPE